MTSRHPHPNQRLRCCIGTRARTCQTEGVSHSLNSPAWVAILTRAIAIWLPIAVATTGLAVIIYGAVQQNLRLTSDDPPVELAQRTAARLDAGAPPATVLPAERVDLAGSLDPFVLVFDTTGNVLASSATLHSQVPNYPIGVFDAVRARGEDHVTWQPENGVRNAARSADAGTG